MKKLLLVVCSIILLTACAKQAASNTDIVQDTAEPEETTVSANLEGWSPQSYVNNFDFTLRDKYTTITYPITNIEYITETYASNGNDCRWEYLARSNEDPERQYDIIVVTKDNITYLDLIAHYDDYDDEQFYIVKDAAINIDEVPANNVMPHINDIKDEGEKQGRSVYVQGFEDHMEIDVSGIVMTDNPEYANHDHDTEDLPELSDADIVSDEYTLYLNNDHELYQIKVTSEFYDEPIFVKIDNKIPEIKVDDHKRKEIDKDTFISYVTGSLIR